MFHHESRKENRKEQVCLTLGWSSVVFALCLLVEKNSLYYSYLKVTFSYPMVTYRYPKVTYSDSKVTYSDPKVTHSDPTHLPLPPPTSPWQVHWLVKWN